MVGFLYAVSARAWSSRQWSLLPPYRIVNELHSPTYTGFKLQISYRETPQALKQVLAGDRMRISRITRVYGRKGLLGSLIHEKRRESPSQVPWEPPSRLIREPSLMQEVLVRALPGELLGAPSVLARAAAEAGIFSPKAVASTSADLSLGDIDPNEEQQPQTLRERLDFKPVLSALDNVVSLIIPLLICGILHWTLKPKSVNLFYAVGMTMILAAWVLICRAVLLERYYTARLVPETALGDEDSKFGKFGEITVHYKCQRSASRAASAAIHCFHGFGANTGSWSLVDKLLAKHLKAQVTAHDMPGFGLTERPTSATSYTLEYNGLLGRKVMDRELLESKQQQSSSYASSPESKPAENTPRILMGHSLGSACAAAEVIQNPKAFDALILVAPAIMAFGFLVPAGRGKSGEVQVEGRGHGSSTTFNHELQPAVKSTRRPPSRNAGLRLAIALAQSFMALVSGITTRLLQPVTIVTLRSAVRNRAFWERGLGRAWYDRNGISPTLVDLYRRPQLVRGWEKGLVRFASARMSGGRNLSSVLADAWRGRIKPTQAEQLADLVMKQNLKVLIVHGEQDRLVPASNSRRLAALLPGARLVLMPQTGHVPHEEHPQQFLQIVSQFMGTILDANPDS